MSYLSSCHYNADLAQISGPGLPNLAFYDLPGVINVAEVVSDVQSLGGPVHLHKGGSGE